jgi:hypothetical protein
LSGGIPLVDYACLDDINLMGVVVLGGKAQSIFQCLTIFLYSNARVLNVMARTRQELGSARLCLAEYLYLIVFAATISSL